MRQLTAEIAGSIVERHPLGIPFLKEDGTSHRVRGYRFLLQGRYPRHLVISLPDRRAGPTVYINRRSAELEEFPVNASEHSFSGVSVSKEYAKGHTGVTGDAGISTAAASCPTLHPRDNDVLRLSCRDADGFTKLVRWYSGEITLSEASTAYFGRAEELDSLASVDLRFQKELEDARSRSAVERRRRLADAPRFPRRITVTTSVFVRRADVVIEVLERADGVCEGCGAPAPFPRATTGEPYLEVHHRIRLADNGEDTVKNAIALCPNCHRKSHYG